MGCGYDSSTYEYSYDAYAAEAAYETDQYYNGDSRGYQEYSYSRSTTRAEVQADILAAQQAGYK